MTDGGMFGAPASIMANQQHDIVASGALHRLVSIDKRASAPETEFSPPAHVRGIGVALTDDDHSYIRHKLRTKLGKFATSIQRVSVRVTDLNGPRGGVDQVCAIKVVLSGLPSVVVIRRHAAAPAAMDAALHAIEQAVRGIVGRRRMKPLRHRIARRDVGRF